MKFYQAVYQTDSHGFNVTYSVNIFKTKEHAELYLEGLKTLMGKDFMYDSWVRELFVDFGD